MSEPGKKQDIDKNINNIKAPEDKSISQQKPIVDEEFGKCCFCDEPCNPCSQCCGRCARGSFF